MWALTRDQTCTPCIGRLSLNHWAVREVPTSVFYQVTGHVPVCTHQSFYVLKNKLGTKSYCDSGSALSEGRDGCYAVTFEVVNAVGRP